MVGRYRPFRPLFVWQATLCYPLDWDERLEWLEVFHWQVWRLDEGDWIGYDKTPAVCKLLADGIMGNWT